MPHIRPLVPELAQVAASQCNEVEGQIPQQIQKLRCWVEHHKTLKARSDDQFLIAFLRFCKYDENTTKERIEYYYTYKSTVEEPLKFKQIDDMILRICRTGIFTTLPKPVGLGGPRIHFTRMNLIDPNVFTVQDLFRFHTIRSEIELNTDDNWIISGVVEIVDCSKIPYAFLRQFDASTFKKMAAFLEYGVPTALMGTHIINASKEVQLVLNIMRSLMKQKNLLYVHADVDSLYSIIGKQYLPNEYGGTNGTLESATMTFFDKLIDFKDYFLEDQSYGFIVPPPGPSPKSCPTSKRPEENIRNLEFD